MADEDEGHDPNKLETALLRDRFDRHAIYSSLAAESEEVANLPLDTALAAKKAPVRAHTLPARRRTHAGL